MKKSSIISGTIILTIAGFLCKFLGAFSKVPLTNILTSKGVGIYQLIFPLYSLLLLLSSSGIPIAISKIISENNNFDYGKKVVKYALKLMFVISSILTLLIIILSGFISNIQGNPQVKICYIIIAPSIIFVSLISVYRGYFQGNQNFKPTAICQIVEQVVKISLIYLYFRYKKNFLKNSNLTQEIDVNRAEIGKIILKTALPITITSIIMPMLSLLDSIIFMQGLTNLNFNTSMHLLSLG